MKRIGIIDNLQDIQNFAAQKYEDANAAEVMHATGGNTGNIAFVYGVNKLIQNTRTRIGWGWTPSVTRERVDHLVVCCANQIGAHVDLGIWAEKLYNFNLPVTLIGLGAQSTNQQTMPEVPKGTIDFLTQATKLNASTKPNIAVRGKFTQSVLKKLGFDSLALGCPSLHISNRHRLGKEILARQIGSKFMKVAVAAGNPWHQPSAKIENKLVEIVDNYDGEYILQHPESMLSFAYGELTKISKETIDHFLKIYESKNDLQSLMEWYRRNAVTFVDAPNWMKFLRKFDAAVGPRYHGIALAIQAGVPGCVISIDSRTEELCEGTGIKSITHSKAHTLSADELVHECIWTEDDANIFDDMRSQKALEYTEFMDSNEIKASDHLVKLAEH